MKILIVNTYDTQGGAARAAYRLHRSLLDAGVDSWMLVQSRSGDDDRVIGPVHGREINTFRCLLRTAVDALPRLRYTEQTSTLFSPAWIPFGGVIEAIEAINPDVVHLHWICGGMIRIEDLERIQKPIVWSLHDMWAFTGGCHYDEECGKYKSLCGPCPVLGSQKEKDLSRRIFMRKMAAYSKMENLTIVGLSRWLAECALHSRLLGNKRVVNLPNPIDTASFAPVDIGEARKKLGLPLNKRLILFGAMSATSDPRKGYRELVLALEKLPQSDDTELAVFGSTGPKHETNSGFRTHYLGHIDEASLHLLYCAADVMVVPSLQENLSNAIMESLACGTPVVGFGIGGNGDLIDHKTNGYLAKPFSPSDLAKGIAWVLN